MIGQIERGDSSPTLTTIWKIANGLKVSFTSLINNPQPDTKVVLRNDVQVLSEDNGDIRCIPHFLSKIIGILKSIWLKLIQKEIKFRSA